MTQPVPPTDARPADAFRVDPDQLGALAAALARTGHSLQDALAALSDTAAVGIGTSGLDRACQEFQQHWSQRLTRLHQQLDDTAEGVRGAARGYLDTERGLTALLSEIPIPVPVPVVGGGR